MRLFGGKRTFSRRGGGGVGGNKDNLNDPNHDDSIGSDISTKDQFDIVIPIKSKNKREDSNAAALSSSRSWGAHLLLGNGVLDNSNHKPSGVARPHGEDDTTVSSITTAPDWQPQQQQMQSSSYNPGTNDGAQDGAGPFGASRRYQRCSDRNDDDGRTSWACCCAPMSSAGQADEDYYYNNNGGREQPSMMSLGGRSPTTTNALAPTTYRPGPGRTTTDKNGGATMNCAPVPSPSILANETRHDDDDEDDVAEEHGAAVAAEDERGAAAERSLVSTAPIEHHGCAVVPQASAPPSSSSPPTSSSASADAGWCCAEAGLCWGASAHKPDGTDAAHKDSEQEWNARRSRSLFDGLDDDDIGNNTAGGGGAHRSGRGIKNKIKHLRKAIVPWGSNLRQRSKSFRKSKGRNHNNSNQAADHDDPLAAPPMAILATTHRDDHYYWKGMAAE